MVRAYLCWMMAASFLVAAPAYSAQVGVWSFEEGSGTTTADGSGNGNLGILSGGPLWIAGPTGNGLEFDGNRVLVDDHPSLDIAGPITVAAWVRPDRRATQYVVKKAHYGTVDGYELSLSASGVLFARFNQATSGNTYKLSGATSYPTDGATWMHVAAVFDGSEIRLYADGVLDGTLDAFGLVIAANDVELSMGAQDTGSSGLFDGGLDEVSVFDHALDAGEIEALANLSGPPADGDGDGVPDAEDAFPSDPAEWADADGDGLGDNADPDDDDDGMPDAWEIEHAFDPLDPADADGDADGDGATNLAEYLAGTNPRDASYAIYEVGHWPFDEGSGTSADDSSTEGNHASLVSGAGWSTGHTAFGLELDGSGARALVPDHPSLDLAGEMTVAAWVRPAKKATQYLVKKTRSSTDGYELSLSSSGVPFVRFNQASSGNTYKVLGASAYPVDGATWMHLAATFDGASIRFYIDGVLEATQPAPGLVIGANTRSLSIGARDDGSSGLEGGIDEVHLFSVALSEGEIGQLMAGAPALPDGDGDGVPDESDAFPSDPAEWSDNDADGTGDNADLDDDDDTLPDAWEIAYGLDPLDPSDAPADPDADGLSSLTEYALGTDPLDSDSDGDSAPDGTDEFPLDPAEWADTDADGLGDNADLDDDGDGMPDLWENQYGFDALDASDALGDADGDGVSNLMEFQQGSDPLVDPIQAWTGHWQLNENAGSTAADLSDKGNHGTLQGSPQWVPGAHDSALEFGGGGDRVLVPNAASLDITGSISVGAWLRPTRERTAYLIKKSRHGSSDGYELSLSSSGVAFVRFNQESSGNTYRLNSTQSYPTDGATWIHVAAVFDGTQIRLYINGALDGTLDSPGLQIASNTDDLGIGAQDDGKSSFEGAMDDVFLYASALTESEIGTLMSGELLSPDTDGDGVSDDDDAFPDDPAEWADNDGDGVGDNADPDDDDDGLPDAWEETYGLDRTDPADALIDSDGDGASNGDEFLAGTHPFDRDGDFVADADDAFPDDPAEWVDTDGDGQGDNGDTDDDGDGMPDAYEIGHGLDPLDAGDSGTDADSDGLANLAEFAAGTDPQNADSDGDGVVDGSDHFPLDAAEWVDTDGDGQGDNGDSDDDADGMPDTWELTWSFDPLDGSDAALDADFDGVSNLLEYTGGTHPRDRDGDGVSDAEDAFPTDPTEWADTDGDSVGNNVDLDDDNDGMPDVYELSQGLDPEDANDAGADPDGDGLSNLEEYEWGTDPFVNLDDLAVGYWALDEAPGSTTVIDGSGNGHDGAFAGPSGSPSSSPGIAGNALAFNASGAHVAVPDAADLDLQNALTLMAWLSPMKLDTQHVLEKAVYGETDGYELSLSASGRVHFRINQDSAGNAYKLFSVTTYPDDGETWMHVAAVFDGAEMRLYVDGVLDSSMATPGLVIGVNGEPFTIGGYEEETAYAGAVDEVYLFDQALSTTDIAFLMQKDLPPDEDADGVPDEQDAFPFDPSEWSDADADGIGNNADVDDDNDGMPDLWEQSYALDPFDPSDAFVDSDGDGTSNLDEYLEGTNPRGDLSDHVSGVWKLDEDGGGLVIDSTTLENDGTIIGSPDWVSGVRRSAMDFDGERVIVPDAASLDASDGLTLAAWIRPETERTQYILKKARYQGIDGFELSLSGSTGAWFARFNQASEGNTYKITSNVDYPHNGSDWMHVAVTFDGQDIRLYSDGVLDRVVSAPGLVIAENDLPFSIGSEDDGAKPFKGALDNVRMHRRALTAQQIADLVYADSLPTLDDWGIADLDSRSTTTSSGEKPQSKIWTRNGEWFAVFPIDSGTWLHRLDGAAWTPLLEFSSETDMRADYAIDELSGDVHVLLFDEANTKLASLEYVPGSPGTYQMWSTRPTLASVPVSSSAETASMVMDGTGRLWVAYDTSSTIRVRYADPADGYAAWSASTTVATGVTPDDIGALIAFEGKIGMFWSNQVTQRFGFRYHFDSDDPSVWSTDEMPGAAGAVPVGNGFADDHINLAAAEDGTLYAAIKTSYDTPGHPVLGLLVRRPDGSWDDLYEIDVVGTRPVVVVSDALGELVVVYTDFAGGGNIRFRTSDARDIDFGPIEILMPGIDVNDATSTNQSFLDELIVLATTAAPGRQLVGVSLAP